VCDVYFCVLSIIVPLPPGKNPFVFQINIIIICRQEPCLTKGTGRQVLPEIQVPTPRSSDLHRPRNVVIHVYVVCSVSSIGACSDSLRDDSNSIPARRKTFSMKPRPPVGPSILCPVGTRRFFSGGACNWPLFSNLREG
jgi:hypothetical protein